MVYTYIRRNIWIEVNIMELRRRLIELIKRKKKPEFLRHLWWKFAKFRNNLRWVRPKGKDNKMRLKLKGYPPVVSVGYRTPNIIRGLHPTALKPVVVHNVDELKKYNPHEVIVYVGRTVGLRKRLEIVKKAQELGFKVANEVIA
ncbi:MAG TPA: 50S ribosomal protein L32e [Acidilobales archaeon]|nr:50S ribosomal protein L32e [Acidilobales archaeon]